MANTTIRLKRGTEAQVDAASLADYEVAFTTDSKKLVVYDGSSKIKYEQPGAASEEIYVGTAGETLAQYDAVYLSTGEVFKAQCDGTADEAEVIGLVTESGGIAAEGTGNILTYGQVTNVGWSWTPQEWVYVGATPGSLTQTAPSTTGQYVVPVGVAVDSNTIAVRPSVGWVTLATLQGPQGDQGAPGADSTVPGPQGDQGNQGNQGVPGADSTVAGPQGNQGDQGDQGNQGNQGDQGDQGDQGFQGVPGADSVVAGPQGDQGDQGDQGNQGNQGVPGADSVVAGPQGNQGDQGYQGNQGVPGADSTVAGPQGDQGDQGDQGNQGTPGPQGNQGDQGAQGATPAMAETLKTATGNLSTGEVSNTLINNYGQGAAMTLTLPAAAQNYSFACIVSTIGYAIYLKAGAGDKIYLDGTALDDGDKVGIATPAIGDMCSFFSFKTGASAWDWYCCSVKGGWVDSGA